MGWPQEGQLYYLLPWPTVLDARLGMSWRVTKFGILLAVTLALVPFPAQAEITGRPRIIDGDTIEIQRQRISLSSAGPRAGARNAIARKIAAWRSTAPPAVGLKRPFSPVG